MTFNRRYGILSNWTRSWFLRRVETDGRKTLKCAGPIEPQGMHAQGTRWIGIAQPERLVLFIPHTFYFSSALLWRHKDGPKGSKESYGSCPQLQVLYRVWNLPSSRL